MDPNTIASPPPPASSSPSPEPEFSVNISPATPSSESAPPILDVVAVPDGSGSEKNNTNTNTIGQYTERGVMDFTVLPEPELTSEIIRLSSPQILNDGRLHTASLQPHPNPRHHNQDRIITEEWIINGTKWKFRGVFDGHANGDETVDYVCTTLPTQIRLHLQATSIFDMTVDTISTILSDSITSIDESIEEGILSVFPTVEDIQSYSDEEIREIVNDGHEGERGVNNLKITRGMRGTTVLVVLIDPIGGMWTASLGDCQAVLGTKQPSGEWTPTLLSSNHNATENDEVERLKAEHPGEEGVVSRQRVLGVIAVTRAIGDFEFKLPSIYTSRVFANAIPGFNRPPSFMENTLKWCLTPPYVSNKADVHYILPQRGAKLCLIMCSDGLLDLYAGESRNDHVGKFDMTRIIEEWTTLVGKEIDSLGTDAGTSTQEEPDSDSSSSAGQKNLALYLLREGLGGSNVEKVSNWITLEWDEKWMDDTSVLVELLNR